MNKILVAIKLESLYFSRAKDIFNLKLYYTNLCCWKEKGKKKFFQKSKRLNSNFRPLTFMKLRFWSPKKKKLQNRPLSFAPMAVLAPRPILTQSTLTWHLKKMTCGTLLKWCECHVSVDRVKIGLGAKTVTKAKLRRWFCSFFLRGPKSQLREN